MAKKCFSMKDESFDKILKKEFPDKKKLQKIYETIKELENSENEYMSSGQKDRTKLNKFGKTLSRMGQKDTYCLEVGTDRFLAHVIEDEKSKVYVWYWGGSHEKYNNVLKNLPKKKNNPDFEDKVSEKLTELEVEDKKANACKNISSMREEYSSKGSKSIHRHK